MRAVTPSYNNNEEIRYENKIKNNKNHKNDVFRIIMIVVMMMVNSTMRLIHHRYHHHH